MGFPFGKVFHFLTAIGPAVLPLVPGGAAVLPFLPIINQGIAAMEEDDSKTNEEKRATVVAQVMAQPAATPLTEVPAGLAVDALVAAAHGVRDAQIAVGPGPTSVPPQ